MDQKQMAKASSAVDQTLAPENMNIVIVGHVDHGKSTVIGRLLADTGSLPEGKLEAVKRLCEQTSKVFEYSFLLDALENERDQGITIDMARCFFQTPRRRYMILDAPGHIEFLKNMVTGASRAEAAILIIDAHEGIQENSRRHGLLISLLGIRQLVVCVNKMDLVGYSEDAFNKITGDYSAYLKSIGVEALGFVPCVALKGENLAHRSDTFGWYHGKTVLEFLDSFLKVSSAQTAPLRMPVQDVYKFTSQGDDRRILAGRVESGDVRLGDEVILFPSQKKSRVKTIESVGSDKGIAIVGQSTGITLTDQIYAQRGEIVCRMNEPLPQVTSLFRSHLFWLGRKPMQIGKRYVIKLGTAKVEARLKTVHSIVDSQDTKRSVAKTQIERHDIADCTIETLKPIAVDLNRTIAPTGRYVIVDEYEIAGGGVVNEIIEDSMQSVRTETLVRETNFIKGDVSNLDRAERYGQDPSLVIVTGSKQSQFKDIGRMIEAELFARGRLTYFLGLGTIKYGMDQDVIDQTAEQTADEQRHEHIRRLGETSYLLLDAGLITIITARDLSKNEIDSLKTLVSTHRTLTVSLGEARGVEDELCFANDAKGTEASLQVIEWLVANRRIYVPGSAK